MNGYALWLLWIVGFGFLAAIFLARIIANRGTTSALLRALLFLSLTLSLLGVGSGLYQLLTMPPTQLAAPLGNALLLESAIAAVVLLGLVIREIYVWSSWRLARRGGALFAAGKYADALMVFDRLRKRRIYRAQAWASKGTALLALGHLDEALACTDEALRLSPRGARTWMIKGQVLLGLRQETEALAAIEQAMRLSPRDGPIWATQGIALYRMGRFSDAREASERALALLGKKGPAEWRAAALATSALALSAEQRPEEALTLAEQAIVVSPTEARAYLAEAQALKQLGRVEEMRVTVEQGVSIVEQLFANRPEHPNLTRLRTQLMQVLEREESAPEAQEA